MIMTYISKYKHYYISRYTIGLSVSGAPLTAHIYIVSVEPRGV